MSIGPFAIETKYGTINASITQADHTYIDFGHSKGSADSTPITCRGVVYGGSCHVYQWTDGSWNIGPEFDKDKYTGEQRLAAPSLRYHSLYLNRRDSFLKPASDAARKAVGETVLEAFREWSLSHADAFNVAQDEYLESEREKRRANIVELRAKIAELETEIAALEIAQ